MGTNLRGLLGLGRILINTGGNSHPIVFPKNEKIIDFKVGKSHALALTEDGKVYGWGNNSDGQIGCRDFTNSGNIHHSPIIVYPLEEFDNEDFIPAK
jgi:alpha-tubulin suppressor-like RCC1 family protein